jgi:hypothetical protein
MVILPCNLRAWFEEKPECDRSRGVQSLSVRIGFADDEEGVGSDAARERAAKRCRLEAPSDLDPALRRDIAVRGTSMEALLAETGTFPASEGSRVCMLGQCKRGTYVKLSKIQ